MKTIKITNDFWSVGVIDKKLNVFDVMMKTTYGSSYNSYVLKTNDGFVLFDTIKLFTLENKEPSLKTYLKHLKEIVGDLTKIKYIVVTHTEPDHSGALLDILKFCNKNCQVLASETAIEYLENIFNTKLNFRAVNDEEEIKIADKTLQFNHIPMMHWPDTIFTIIKELKVAVTCDTLGAHYALETLKISTLDKSKIKEFKEAFVYYYEAVMAHYKMFVTMAMVKFEKFLDLIEIVATGHGPILDNKEWIKWGIKKYKELSNVVSPKNTQIVTLVSSAYGFTNEISKKIQEGIKKIIPNVTFINHKIDALSFTDKLKQKILEDIKQSHAILVGSPTLNNDAVPYMHEILGWLSPPENFSKYGAAFGSYGWSGEGIKNLTQRLSQARIKTMKGLLVRFRINKEKGEIAMEWGTAFGKYIQSGIVDDEFQYKNENLMKETIWKQ